MRDLVTCFVVCVSFLVGCATVPVADPGVEVPNGPAGVGQGADPQQLALDRRVIRNMAGVFNASYLRMVTPGTTSAGPTLPEAVVGGTNRQVETREAWLLASGGDDDAIVLEQFLLVGDPPAVARMATYTWTPHAGGGLVYEPDATAGGRWVWKVDAGEPGAWRVRVSEPDGRPVYDVWGRWQHSEREGFSSVFRPLGRSVFPPTSPSEAEVREAGGWTGMTTLRVGPVKNQAWSSITDGETLAGGVRSEMASFEPDLVAQAEVLEDVRAYWAPRSAFWSAVRSWWDARVLVGGLSIRDEVDGRPMWRAMFALGDRAARGEFADDAEMKAVIGETLERYVVAVE